MNISDKTSFITAIAANPKGKIFDLPGYASVGMSAGMLKPLTTQNAAPAPYGTELMLLPERKPIFYNLSTNKIETLTFNPFNMAEKIYPVAAFNSPGHIISYTCAYTEKNNAIPLPLFSYGAAGWHNNQFVSAVIPIDLEKRQDLRLMPIEKVIKGVKNLRKKLPNNRLRKHLEKCALEYGCPAGKNLFLKRYEAPLPTSVTCNAKCLGCLSLQKNSGIRSSQDRITFKPSPAEIAEIALEHILIVKKSIVSFGQGREGDPIYAADVIEPAIKIIRKKTTQGTINVNTNASKPEILTKFFDAGIDSIRVSINSFRKSCYNAYFRPQNYTFQQIMQTIDIACQKGVFVSINYLNCPGFTDSAKEAEAFINFLKNNKINRIQWRNLNYDPIRYINAMNTAENSGTPYGVKNHLKNIAKTFPNIQFGYFNPPKEDFKKPNMFLSLIREN
ncbi:MAG: radical SAM protein [Deltaproteobacteria bacterium]|nr:radical SAM protein [Deltaproteobacteria bacterium]